MTRAALLILLACFCLPVQAEQCVEVVNGVVRASSATGDCSLVLMTGTEFQAVKSENLVAVLNDLFAFNLEVFNWLMGMFLVSFIVGHYTGRVARILGK
ncbi:MULTISPECIES: hypothetical protein [Gammaproteobacteria]|uniref:hypothetical protein n=1 Tax=Gammaproteobacteria TaxID=1236 RepID=UPI003A8D4DB8